MPMYLIERGFADEAGFTQEEMAFASAYEAEREIRWITSFLSADKKKSYCLYEADDVDRLRKHAEDLGLPADTILEVSELQR